MERKVVALRGSGFATQHLRLACEDALREQLPLRDAIVLRHAKRYADMAASVDGLAWPYALLALSRSVPAPTFALWLLPLDLLGLRESVAVLTAPQGIAAWCERRYSTLIRKALSHELGREIAVEFVSDAGSEAA